MADAAFSLDLAYAAGAALVGGVLARLLKQSVLLGYLLAGVVIGPFTPGPVSDVAVIERLADIGVVFLMFGIGVHFSLRQLAAVKAAAVGAGIQVPLSAAIGFAVGRAAGWSWQEAAVFGAVGAISGGTVLTKLLAERGEEESQHGRLAVAWSICQDLATILLVVLVSALAAEPDALLPALGLAFAKAAAFVAGMLLIGTRVIPWLLAAIARLGSRELFIIAVAGLSLGVALLAESVGLSLALGAFIAGVLVSESDLSYHALGEVLPLREIFAALFFVSVGMLVDPRLLWEQLPLFLALVLAVLSKGMIVVVLALALRASVHTAVLAGLGLAQSAEFSFILARQGVAEGVVSDPVFSLMLAATVATIALAPLLYRLAPALERGLQQLPMPRAREPSPVELPPLRNHVVICGAGRVGSVIAAILRQRGQSYLVIELDRRLVERLRAAGEPVVFGSAAAEPVLARAQLERARTLVVTIPDPVVTREVVREARQRNPRLDVVVRAASPDEAIVLQAQGAAEAVVAQRELALEMTRHTLQRIGLSTPETQAIIQRLRAQPGEGGPISRR